MGNSLFEQHIRKLSIPTCNLFLKEGTLTPIAFKSAGNLYCDKVVGKAYPHLSTMVLEADGITLPPQHLRVAVLFSGGPASGGHNVIVALKRMLKDHTLLGVKNGPGGLLRGDLFEITNVDHIANTGGFDFLGTDRTKIKTQEQLDLVRQICKGHGLDAIVIIGGDDSNTNAAIMAEYLLAKNVPVQVISVPKTMDGDVQVRDLLPCPFGYDTACRVYAELIGNILQDTPSSHKYWHFIRLMGRTASQVLLEVALQTQPPIALISEEIQAQRESIHDVVERIADTVIMRAQQGRDYGVVLVPEGLLEFVPEVRELIDEIDEFFGLEEEQILNMEMSTRKAYFAQHLRHSMLYSSLPSYIQEMLVAARDAHGNLQVSQIPTERLLAELVAQRVRERAPAVRFSTQTHSFGYEGRCGAPTRFDAMLAYNLGLTAASLLLDRRSGYMAAFTDFTSGGTPIGIPLKSLLTAEEREGKKEYVISKALVQLDSPAFQHFAQHRDAWAKSDAFCSPGPRQLWGPTADQMPKTVVLNQKYTDMLFTI